VGRHSTFLSREEHGVAAGALFYKVEGEKHCVMRKSVFLTKFIWFRQIIHVQPAKPYDLYLYSVGSAAAKRSST
jgi:hypothetical protein